VRPAHLIGPTLREWPQRSQSPWGRWLFRLAVGQRLPFFRILGPRVLELEPAVCRLLMPKRRRLQRLSGDVQSSALASLCELAASLVAEVTMPPVMQSAPRGMTIEYLRRVESAVTATARLDKREWRDAQTVAVPVSVVDVNSTEVVRAVVTMHVLPRSGR